MLSPVLFPVYNGKPLVSCFHPHWEIWLPVTLLCLLCAPPNSCMSFHRSVCNSLGLFNFCILHELCIKGGQKNSVNWNSWLLQQPLVWSHDRLEVLIGLQVPKTMQTVSLLSKQKKFCLSPVKYLRKAVPELRTKQFLNGATLSKFCRIVL